MRFSLQTMLLIVTGVAILCCPLLFANEWIGDAYFSGLWAMLLLALTAAIQRQGAKRAFWIGFLIAAGGYSWLALPSQLSALSAVVGRSQISNGGLPQSQLITTKALLVLYQDFCLSEHDPRVSQLAGAYQTGRQGLVPSSARSQYLLLAQYVDPSCVAFVTIGHAAVALLCGVAVGSLSSRLYVSRPAAPPDA